MPKLRLVPFKKLEKVAQAAGFELMRRKGSHCTFRNESGTIITIPDHGSEHIKLGLLRRLIRDMGLSIQEYHDLLDEI